MVDIDIILINVRNVHLDYGLSYRMLSMYLAAASVQKSSCVVRMDL
jgi:hypothetical protein